jgi:CDP-diacylglycerol--glycerol-3-phosphate 3-phosphatidyltransferase
VPDVDAFLQRWRELHGGVDPRGTVLVRRWLTAVHACARPLARHRVRPDVLTLVGLALAVVTVPVAALGGRWALLVAGLAFVSAGVDSLDGAVAVLTDRVTAWGALLDAVSDRVADVALALALAALVVAADEPVIDDGWLVALTAAALLVPLVLEYVRARAGGLGLAGLEVVTAGERPSRLIVVVMFALGAGVTNDAMWAWLGLAAIAAISLTGMATLWRALHRRRS